MNYFKSLGVESAAGAADDGEMAKVANTTNTTTAAEAKVEKLTDLAIWDPKKRWLKIDNDNLDFR